MEIRECLSVYLESGYLFDDMSGRLKWFEIDKILISFTYGVVRYVGTWGGCRTEKTLDGKLFYSSEECFKKGESIPKTRLSIYDVFESLYGFIPIGDVRNFLKRVKADPVSVDWKTEGFYWYNNANNTPGECVDFIFHRCNN